MPKKSSPKPQAESKSIEDLTLQVALDAINSKFGKGAIMLAGVNDTMDVERIPFNHPDLDDMTNGGVPRGKVTVIIGDQGGGKSTTALTLIASAQQMGLQAAYIDSEFAFDPEYAQCLGVNTDDLLVAQPQSAENAMDIIDTLVKSKAIGIIVMDSVAATSTQAEIEGGMSDLQRSDKARLMSKAMRKLVGPVSATKTVAVFINQWRDDSSGHGGKQMPAGRALKFASSLIIDVARKETLYKTKGGDKTPTGQITIVKVLKSRVSLPFAKCEVELNFPQRGPDKKLIPGTGGFNIYASIINHALDSGKIIQKGSWFRDADDKPLAQGREKLIALLAQDKELLETLK